MESAAADTPAAVGVGRGEQARGPVTDRADDPVLVVGLDQEPAEVEVLIQVDHRAVTAGQEDRRVVGEVNLREVEQQPALRERRLGVGDVLVHP